MISSGMTLLHEVDLDLSDSFQGGSNYWPATCGWYHILVILGSLQHLSNIHESIFNPLYENIQKAFWYMNGNSGGKLGFELKESSSEALLRADHVPTDVWR